MPTAASVTNVPIDPSQFLGLRLNLAIDLNSIGSVLGKSSFSSACLGEVDEMHTPSFVNLSDASVVSTGKSLEAGLSPLSRRG